MLLGEVSNSRIKVVVLDRAYYKTLKYKASNSMKGW